MEARLELAKLQKRMGQDDRLLSTLMVDYDTFDMNDVHVSIVILVHLSLTYPHCEIFAAFMAACASCVIYTGWLKKI